MGESFVDAVARRYGNPRARWCDGRLERRQKVKVIWDIVGEPRFIEGIAVGRLDKKTKNNLVKIVNPDNGKKQIVRPDNHNILVEW